MYTSTNYSFETQETTTVWEKLNLTTGDVSVWSTDTNISEVVFVGPNPTSILYVNATNEEGDGGVSMYTADANDLSTASLVASLPAPYSGLKAVATDSGDIHFLVYAMAYPNGTAYNAETAETAASTARIYTSIYVRHWDTWLTPQRNAVFGGRLASNNGSYSLDGELTNYVTGLCNVTCAESPVQPYGGSGDYDISADGSQVVFLTKNIDLPLANFTSSQIYLVDFSGTVNDSLPINPIGRTPGAEGASAAPTFSKDGSKIAYVQMNGISYESDKNVLYVANADSQNPNVTALASNWDRSPDMIVWSSDDSTIYVGAADSARERIFPIPLSAGPDYQPTNITNEGTTAGFSVLPNNDLLVSDSKIWSSRDIYTINPTNNTDPAFLLQANIADEALSGLGPSSVSEFYYDTNSTSQQIQSWIIRPSTYSENQTYPLCFIVHGGPQSAHTNAWSTRWNLQVWADQGYIVVAPNPTGSISFGQNLTDAIASNWGSLPYWDLVYAWQHANTSISGIDTSRGVAAGASYGGYMMNWIQGHPLGREFRALVTHDGVTNTFADYATEELWFINHDMGGIFTGPNSTSPYGLWNPISYYENWATPHFVIHNDLDFRLPVSEGLQLFNMLQVKGVESKFLNFPDENHWVLKRENSRVWHEEVFGWINYYSGVSEVSPL